MDTQGSYPATWMLLCAVKLNEQFVGCLCGPYWHKIVPVHMTIQATLLSEEWFKQLSHKPPDHQSVAYFKFEELPPEKENKVISTNMHKTIYSVSRSNTWRQGALMDRGANGGIAGADTHAMYQTDHQVDIQGIDNLQVTDVSIVTTGGVVTTQCGDGIVIMT